MSVDSCRLFFAALPQHIRSGVSLPIDMPHEGGDPVEGHYWYEANAVYWQRTVVVHLACVIDHSYTLSFWQNSKTACNRPHWATLQNK